MTTVTMTTGTPAEQAERPPRLDRAVAAFLILGVAASPIPYLPLSVLGWVAIAPVILVPAVRSRTARIAIVLLATAGAFQLVVDLTNAVPFDGLAKGAARYVGLLVPFVGCLWVIERKLLDRHVVAIVHAVGWLVGAMVFFVPGPGHSLWKFGLLSPVSFLLVAALSLMWKRTGRMYWLAGLSAVVAMALLTGTRSMAVQAGVAMLVCLTVLRSRTPWRSLLGAACAVIAFVVLFSAAATAGLLGDAVGQKWRAQGGTIISNLVVGRPESSFSVAALAADSFVPHGSQAPASRSAYSAGASNVTALAAPERNAMLDRITADGLDLHSVIATATWQGGIVCGAAFAILMFVVLRRTLTVQRRHVLEYGPLYVFCGLGIAWDFLFSPWTYFSGTTWGVMLAIVLAAPSQLAPEGADQRHG